MEAEAGVIHMVRTQKLPQDQFDARVSLTHNVGAHGTRNLYTLVDTGRLAGDARQTRIMTSTRVNDKSVVAQGLIARRAEASAPFDVAAKSAALAENKQRSRTCRFQQSLKYGCRDHPVHIGRHTAHAKKPEKDVDILGTWALTKVLDTADIFSLTDQQAVALVGKVLVVRHDSVIFSGEPYREPELNRRRHNVFSGIPAREHAPRW